MGNCTSKVSAGGEDVVEASAPKAKAAVVAAPEVPAETPPETPEVKNEATVTEAAPRALTAEPPLPARPVAAAATPEVEVAGETATSTPPPAPEGEKETEAADETAISSPPPPEKGEETSPASTDPPVDTAAAAPEAPDEAASSPPPETSPASTDPPVDTAAAAPEAPDEAASSPPPAPEPEPENEDADAEDVPPSAPVPESEKPGETAEVSPEPPAGEQEEQHEEQQEEQQEEEPKQLSFDEWLKDQCKSMKFIPRKGSEELAWEEIYPPQKDLEKPVTQCCAWMGGVSAYVLMAADLGGGTLFDWWNTHIGQGEAETDLTADELFERAVAGLKATILPELREAVEAGAETAVTENLQLKVTLKNCFDAPAPPEGTTGGEDGESYPEPHTWVVGGDMHGFGPAHITGRIVSKDRKYIVGDYCTRPELEKALGRSVEDSEMEVHVEEEEEEQEEEPQEEPQEEQQGEQQEEQQEAQQEEQQEEQQEAQQEEQQEAQQEEGQGEEPEENPKQLPFDEWLEAKCKTMKYIPRKGSAELAWNEIYPAQKDLEKPVTQCCAWMGGLSAPVLMAADLGGGTLFDWWNTHIGQGEDETDLTADELFERAVAGLRATILPELREALEAEAETAVTENLQLKATLKNCFDAPAPPEGTTGGYDGESYPEPQTWVVGGYMYGFGPSHITGGIMSKDRKYVVGGSYTRAEVEKALGRSLDDSELEVQAQEEW